MPWKPAELNPSRKTCLSSSLWSEQRPHTQLPRGAAGGMEEGGSDGPPRWQTAARPGRDSDLEGTQGQFLKSLGSLRP